jgi:prepilin-type N-terminal cleavage/methylation domain-containing protein
MNRRGTAGFTLIEMIVVLVVLGLALGLVMTRGPVHSRRLELDATARQVAGALRLARSRAIAEERGVAVVLELADISSMAAQRLHGPPMCRRQATASSASPRMEGPRAGDLCCAGATARSPSAWTGSRDVLSYDRLCAGRRSGEAADGSHIVPSVAIGTRRDADLAPMRGRSIPSPLAALDHAQWRIGQRHRAVLLHHLIARAHQAAARSVA